MNEITAKQEKAITALLTEISVVAAADKCGISLRTMFLWLKEPQFSETYRNARRDATSQAIARLQQNSSDAVTVLVDIMKDATAPKTIRVTAASKVLDIAIKSVEIDELAARLDALEAAQRIQNDKDKQ